MTLSGNGWADRKSRTVRIAMRAARSNGNPYTPVLIAGNAMVRIPFFSARRSEFS